MKTISGIHVIVFSKKAESVRAFFKDVLGLDSVDAGDGWPIFALPPAELAVHPTDRKGWVEIYLMTGSIKRTVKALRKKGITFIGRIQDRGWGLVARAKLPDGATLGVYEPRHPSPLKTRKKRPSTTD